MRSEAYALSLFHYNIQYTAGQPETYHRNVRECLAPVLDLLVDHPTWTFTVELQGHLVEFLAQSHPGVLTRLRDLMEVGQVELVSSHYSDQLFLAYPRDDLVRSIRRNDALLTRHGLRRSRIFFAQENCFGEGVADLGEWFDLAIVRDSYYGHFYPQETAELAPLYRLEGLRVLIAPSDLARTGRAQTAAGELRWRWHYYGDGEPAATGGGPNLPLWLSGERLADWAARLEGLEREGYRLCGSAPFAAAAAAAGVEPRPLRPVLDGCWHMARARGVFTWMGYHHSPHEQDCLVRSHTVQTRHRLMATEALIRHAAAQGHALAAAEAALDEAWRQLLLAENSDPTGWAPTPTEVQYGIIESDLALDAAHGAAAAAKRRLGLGLVEVDTATGAVTKLAAAPARSALALVTGAAPAGAGAGAVASGAGAHEALAAAGLRLFGAADRPAVEAEVLCYPGEARAERIDVIVRFAPAPGQQPAGAGTAAAAPVCGLALPLQTDRLVYSPALREDRLVDYPLAAFAPEVLYLPLANGLIGLAPDRFCIKHNATMHVAAVVDEAGHEVRFQMERAPVPPRGRYVWRCTLYGGTPEGALALANRINVRPRVVL